MELGNHGSRNPDGNVLKANWNDDKFKVNWWNPNDANSNIRGRVEVSGGARRRAPPTLEVLEPTIHHL